MLLIILGFSETAGDNPVLQQRSNNWFGDTGIYTNQIEKNLRVILSSVLHITTSSRDILKECVKNTHILYTCGIDKVLRSATFV